MLLPLALASALVGLKLWLVAAQPFAALEAPHDGLLYLKLGSRIARGEWLGPYDQLTLIKGPGYPLFIAASNRLRLPLRLTQEALYVTACLTVLGALRPLALPRAGLLAVLGLLLFNPFTYCAAVTGRVVREGIYPALTLLVLATAVGLFLRRRAVTGALVLWAGALGLSLGAFWVTREEGIWVTPPLLLLLVATAAGQRTPSRHRWRALICLLPLALGGAAVLAVAARNGSRYGWFTAAELKSREFREAYGALARIRSGAERRYVPVPRASRRLAYGASPTLAPLEADLEGWLDRVYTGHTCVWLPPEACGEMGTGWFMFALREAAARAGRHRRAEGARAFYARVAAELDAACAAGRLACGPQRSTLAPAFEPRDAPLLAMFAARGAVTLLSFAGYRGDPLASDPALRRQQWVRVTRSHVTPPARAGAPDEGVRRRLRDAAARLYRVAVPLGAVGALLGTLAACRRARDPWARDLALVLGILLLAIVMRVGLLAFLDTTAFLITIPFYLAPAYPLVLLWCGLGCCALGVRGAAVSAPPAQ